ncbi:spindle assembly abnormal protein 6 homolog [Anneissia japonica]|uniref:spindle assembly abnormal protein 6 homolog n=1 Tax=Anneissia japonica TaxID=1529436 RepID=UPI0014256805|nr:spindle assembly abnormal protein 6 homolog [Anneissia japonica]
MTESCDNRGNTKGCAGPTGKKTTKDIGLYYHRGRTNSRPSNSTFESLLDGDSVQKIQAEILSLKSSVQAINILKMLLKDHESVIKSLEQELKENKICIEHLQSRLHRNKLDSSVNLKEHEVFVPGHDKEVLNELLKENIRLRTILNANYSSEEVAEAKKTISELRSKVSELSKELNLKETDFNDYLKAMKSSDSEKDVMISKLKSELIQYYKQRSYDDDVRFTLSGEVAQMRLKIEILVTQMGNMAKELKDYEKIEKEIAKEKRLMEKESNDSGLSLEDQCKSLKEQTSSLSRENTELAKQLKDVISMNTRWQKYSDQREAHVIKLTGENQVVISQNKVLESDCQELRQKLQESQKCLKQKEKEQKESVDAAVLSLEADLGRANEHNANLQKQIATLQNESKQRRVSSQDSERIMLLEHQVKMLTEDFNLERKDRTNLQERHQKLIEKNDQLTEIIVGLQQKDLSSKQQQYQQQYRQQYQQHYQRIQPRFDPMVMQSRCGYDNTFANQKHNFPDEVEVDGLGGQDFADFDVTDDSGLSSRKNDSPVNRFDLGQQAARNDGTNDGDNADANSLEEEQLLRCPRCFRGFKILDHALLVDHVTTCDGQDDDLEIG